MTWKVMRRNAWKDIATWRTKQLNIYTKSQHHALTPTTSKKKKMGSVGELSEVFSQIVLKCLYSARIGRPDILWSVNKLARAITKWTKACDERLARLISYIHHTCGFRQNCHVGNTAQLCRLGLFQDSDFAGDLEDWKSTSGGLLCSFGSRTFCANKLDVQETDISLTQLKRRWNYFSTNPTKPKIRSHREPSRGTPHSTWKTKIQPSTSIWIWIMLVTFRLTWDPLNLVLCNVSLRTMKPWLRW